MYVTSTFTDEDLAGVQWIDGVEGIAGHLQIASNDALTSLGPTFSTLAMVRTTPATLTSPRPRRATG